MPCCLFYFIALLSSIRSLLSELSLFGFPLLRNSKGYTLDSGLTPAQFLRRIIVHLHRARYKALNRKKLAIRAE